MDLLLGRSGINISIPPVGLRLGCSDGDFVDKVFFDHVYAGSCHAEHVGLWIDWDIIELLLVDQCALRSGFDYQGLRQFLVLRF